MTHIEKIQRVAHERDLAELAKQRATKNEIALLVGNVKSLAPRIKELVKIGIALADNNIPLGERKKDIIGYDDMFVTEGIHHRIGFICTTRDFGYTHQDVRGIGICGGGYDGCNFYINTDGEIFESDLTNPFGRDTSFILKCRRFLQGFNKFEKDVFNYVENL